jgi:transposase
MGDYFFTGALTQIPLQSSPPLAGLQSSEGLAAHVSDVMGETGQKIIRALLAGEHDGQVLAKYRNNHIKAGEKLITKALQGSWRKEHLFALKQGVDLYDAYAERLLECDQKLEKML